MCDFLCTLTLLSNTYFVDMFITSVVLCCVSLATGVVVSTIPFYLVCVCVCVYFIAYFIIGVSEL